MKKILLTLNLVVLATVAFGQGYVTVAGTGQNFTNNTALATSSIGGSAASGNGVLGTTTSGQSYYMALLTSTSANPTTSLAGDSSLTTDWLDTGLLGHNNTFAGRLSIGSDVLANNASTSAAQYYILVAWSASLGSSWATVASQLAANSYNSAGFLGWSLDVSATAGGAPPANPLILQGTGSSPTIAPFTLYAVSPTPEPTTMALAGLGIAGLFALRRKK